MPISKLGQLNTTALTVADVYIQIVPPQYLINGVPSNVLGLVGTATWGPVNAATIVGSTANYVAQFGSIQARTYDMGTSAVIAFQQGATALQCVRVTDGTDVAASYAVTNAAVAATGSVSFTTNPSASSTITLNGTAVTFVASGATGNQVNIGGSLSATLASLLTLLQGSADTQLVKFTYAVVGTSLNLTAATAGTAGNSLTIATNVSGATASGATLSGGTASGTGITLTSKYTGTFGNSIQVTLGAGSKVGSYSVKVAAPGISPELFDNITGSGNALWVAIAAAINGGQSNARGPSNIIVATAGAGAATPTATTYALAGGTDGATTINGTVLLGTDTFPRTGMYALRSMGTSVGILCDLTDTTTWASQVAFGESEGVYMILAGPSGQSPTAAATAKYSAGIDSYAAKIMLGDWVYWNDTYNGLPQRLVSPQAFVGGMLANLSPNQSTLNKQMSGVVGTQKTVTGVPYTSAELMVLAQASIDVITNPVPGGKYFGCRNGRNTSSNAVTHGDNYTRMTNYLATTLNSAMGIYVGQIQTTRTNDPTRRQAKATLDAFLNALASPTANGQPPMVDDFQTILDLTNNAPNRQALGYLQADVQVRYGSIIEFFIINLEGGQSVTITRSNVTNA
ncbi:autotransporter outer membrane beta-barrel domain-containing protein [Xanthobacter versatilis]|uniref:hypothetical protein n=1 Tax=Xanthobacter autotrophicus (strain ATCC BAA-1158 / Py2) TaxID=78245 RepID=UPI003728B62B